MSVVEELAPKAASPNHTFETGSSEPEGRQTTMGNTDPVLAAHHGTSIYSKGTTTAERGFDMAAERVGPKRKSKPTLTRAQNPGNSTPHDARDIIPARSNKSHKIGTRPAHKTDAPAHDTMNAATLSAMFKNTQPPACNKHNSLQALDTLQPAGEEVSDTSSDYGPDLDLENYSTPPPEANIHPDCMSYIHNRITMPVQTTHVPHTHIHPDRAINIPTTASDNCPVNITTHHKPPFHPTVHSDRAATNLPSTHATVRPTRHDFTTPPPPH